MDSNVLQRIVERFSDRPAHFGPLPLLIQASSQSFIDLITHCSTDRVSRRTLLDAPVTRSDSVVDATAEMLRLLKRRVFGHCRRMTPRLRYTTSVHASGLHYHVGSSQIIISCCFTNLMCKSLLTRAADHWTLERSGDLERNMPP
jgi:hypothetical protein